MKYIVITGGVVSGLGKGITISSIGRILQSSGVKVTSIKIDPYFNVDAGTMSPYEHGETFVLDDGGETDLDLGNYERFLDITLTRKHNITSGKVYQEVIKRERRGDYLGKTVQMVPHATDMVQSWFREVAKISVDGTGICPDVCLIEVGGTVGDIESMVFLEALRQFQFNIGKENILFFHVSLVPVLGTVGEQKTKPTQHSVKELMSLGLAPDIIVCRSSELLQESTKKKISVFCQVPVTHIISVHDVSNIYHVPLILVQQNIHSIIKNRFNLEKMFDEPDFEAWSTMADTVDRLVNESNPLNVAKIAIVGKYIGLEGDSYLSVTKALKHCSIHLNTNVQILWVDSSELEEEMRITDVTKYETAWKDLKSANGILVPGGFGVRGVNGKVTAAKYARDNKIPFLGVCLGMQVMVIEYARHVLELSQANSAEFDESSPHPVVIFMPEINQNELGGTMRLGARATSITLQSNPSNHPASEMKSEEKDLKTTKRIRMVSPVKGLKNELTLAAQLYGHTEEDIPFNEEVEVWERHRHRYEVNPTYVDALEKAGLKFTGRDDRGERMEMVELPRDVHPFYFGVQFHPEFKSRPNRPSPPFYAFVAMTIQMMDASKKLDITMAGKLWRSRTNEIKKEIVARISNGSFVSPDGDLPSTPNMMSIPLQKMIVVQPVSVSVDDQSNSNGELLLDSSKSFLTMKLPSPQLGSRKRKNELNRNLSIKSDDSNW